MLSKIKENHLIISLVIGVSTASALAYYYYLMKKKQINKKTLLDLIGKTPLIYLPTLSAALQCEIYCKAEHLNPFGSSKDRAVLHMLQQGIKSGKLKQHEAVVEASSGSTAISLVHICKILKLKPYLYLPNDLAEDKYNYLDTLGANLVKVAPVSIVDPNHFFKLAQSSSQTNKQFFLNQFQNDENYKIHYLKTGPQIYKQTQGKINTFVCSAGTGGTIAGVSNYLKQQNKNIKIILADPQGSGLYNKVKYNVLFTKQQKEGFRLKNPFDTIIEGVGLNRQTNNFKQAIIDEAYKITDQQALHMGLFVGSSSALNLVAVVKHARKNKNSVIVTVIHDSGNRYMKKFYNLNYLLDNNIKFQRKKQYIKNELDFVK